jgi:hypothetical protein
VLVCDINESTAQATASKDSANLAAHKMDVTKRTDWEATMAAVKEKFGRCDILVNNAGWSYVNKATVDVTEEEFERVFDVNVKGVYLGCQAWVNQAIERKEGGVIINIASVGATRPRPGLVWYNASKGAVWNVSILVRIRIGDWKRLMSYRRPRDLQRSTVPIRYASIRSARLSQGQGSSRRSPGWRTHLRTGRSSLETCQWVGLERSRTLSMRVSSWQVTRPNSLQEPTWRSTVVDASRRSQRHIGWRACHAIDGSLLNCRGSQT